MVTFRRYLPSDDLRDVVTCYAVVEAVFDGLGTMNIVVPDGAPELLFVIRGGMRLALDGDERSIGNGSVVGQVDRAGRVVYDPGTVMLWVKLKPWCLAWLLAVPGHHLNNAPMEAAAVAGTGGWRSLSRQVEESETPRAAIAAIEQHLRRIIHSRPRMDRLARTVATGIMNARGVVDIGRIASRLGITSRYVQQTFREHIGVSPRFFARIIRIRHISVQLAERPDAMLTDTAYAWEYFDQSHFNRDFKGIVGMAPSAFVATSGTTALPYIAFGDDWHAEGVMEIGPKLRWPTGPAPPA